MISPSLSHSDFSISFSLPLPPSFPLLVSLSHTSFLASLTHATISLPSFRFFSRSCEDVVPRLKPLFVCLFSGNCAIVRYARQVVRGSTQSQWPEYAVKVINTKTIEELNYEACVNREICILRMLSHPGVARMVASFRYRDGAYLVLEYAAKGDLHSVLRRLNWEGASRLRKGAFQGTGNRMFATNRVVYGRCRRLSSAGGCQPLAN